MKKALIILLFLLIFFIPILKTRADEYDDITKQLNALSALLNSKETDYQNANRQLENIKKQVIFLENEIIKKEKEVVLGEDALIYQKDLLNERAKSYYKNIGKSSLSILNLLAGLNLAESLRNFNYQKSLVDEDKNTIIKIVLYIKDLERKKAELVDEKAKLSVIKEQVDQQAAILAGEISQTRQKIAELSARQQQLLAQKLASLNISRSAASLGRCDSDLSNGRDPGFSPRFAVFTYGVPNRVGLNQWGAYGRAKAGQNYDQILHAYYNFDGYQNFDANTKINVVGNVNWNGSLEDYVKRIYEVPGDWPSEVLKAQAIAARSYVLAYTNKGAGSICDSESCQVFKSDPKGGAWEQAVNDTAGKAMIQGGNPIKAWFSSTHGGYVFTSGEVGWSGTSWTKHNTDTSGGANNFTDLQNNAYDRESPWFYCDWGSRSQYNKTAWLKPDELADVVNALMLAKKDSSVQEHLYQTDNPPSGTDTWSADRVKSELRSRGGNPFGNVGDASVSVDFGSGRTSSVTISGDAGTQTFDSGEFKNFFNLRAPANIQIVGPLFNLEKR